jgi:hypothetical protein
MISNRITRDLTDDELEFVASEWEHSPNAYRRAVSRECFYVLAADAVVELNDGARIAMETRASRRRLALVMIMVAVLAGTTWAVCGWLVGGV